MSRIIHLILVLMAMELVMTRTVLALTDVEN